MKEEKKTDVIKNPNEIRVFSIPKGLTHEEAIDYLLEEYKDLWDKMAKL